MLGVKCEHVCIYKVLLRLDVWINARIGAAMTLVYIPAHASREVSMRGGSGNTKTRTARERVAVVY